MCQKRCPDLVLLDDALLDPSANLIALELESDVRTLRAKIVKLNQQSFTASLDSKVL